MSNEIVAFALKPGRLSDLPSQAAWGCWRTQVSYLFQSIARNRQSHPCVCSRIAAFFFFARMLAPGILPGAVALAVQNYGLGSSPTFCIGGGNYAHHDRRRIRCSGRVGYGVWAQHGQLSLHHSHVAAGLVLILVYGGDLASS